MGDKSHVIGALVYNFISGKSFCITTIDRPLITTIMNLIFCGNLGLALISGDAAVTAKLTSLAQATGVTTVGAAGVKAAMEAIQAVQGVDLGDDIKTRIFNSLKNLGLAINPFDTASAILNRLPGFYGRYMHGIARGGK